MQFFPFSPLRIKKTKNGLVAADKDSIGDFWDRVATELEHDLADAVGCYIFSIRAGKGVKPWYVGLAARQSFRKECFTAHKLNHYNTAIAGRKGTPMLTLIPKYTRAGRYAKPRQSGHRDIQFLETMLIGTCVRRNSCLLNVRDTKLLREMVVPGLLNNPKGRDYDSVTKFKGLLGK